MSLYDRISVYLDKKGIDYTNDEIGIDGKVVLVDYADGKGAQIVKWEFEAPLPTKEELSAIPVAELDDKKEERENRAKQLQIPMYTQSQVQKLDDGKKMKKGSLWFNRGLKKLQFYDGKDIVTL